MALPSRPLRVTMVNKYYWPPHLGGVETHLRDISEGLVEHAGAQVRAIVCNEGSERAIETIGGVEVTRLPRQLAVSSAPIALAMPGALSAEMRRSDAPDVMHFHFPYPWGELSALMARPDVPKVVLYHSDIVRQKRMLAAYRPFLERFLDGVDLIMASSPNMVEHSEFLAPRAEKCRVINFGLRFDHIADNAAAISRAKELRAPFGDRKVVLFVGRLVYYKGADVLVKAMEDVDAQLVMIGRGPLDLDLRRMAADAGIADRVTWIEPVEDAELAAWYHAADVFALPSVARSEAFGLVQIEAHAAGTPVVSTDLTTGVPYANLHEVTGLTVPVGDAKALASALTRLLSDDALRVRLGEQAKRRALTEFTIPHMVEQTLAVYDEAIQRHAVRKAR